MSRSAKYSIWLPMGIGGVALALLVGVIGVWSMRAEIAGAIIAPGTVVVENNRQVVQHREGGVIAEIAARDGDHVDAGDLLLRLDDTLLASELAVIDLQLVEFGARRARLEAERDGTDRVSFPDEISQRTDAGTRDQIAGQTTLFEARRESFARELGQLEERIAQTGNRITGTEAQLQGLRAQDALVAADLDAQTALLAKGLTQARQVSALRREAADITGQIGKLTADIAQFRGEIAGFEIEKLRLGNTRREAAIAELRDIQLRELELLERQRGLNARLARLDIRAPVAGVVFGSTVFAAQGVVQPAEPLMYVVPQDQPLVIEAEIDAIHVDQVYPGQPVTLRFSAFNQRVTPEIAGQITGVSADVLENPQTGAPYYRVNIMALETELAKLEGQEMLPGMPVEAYLRTEDRTPLSYLTKPLTDYFERAMRES
ncbi:MAG: HlyD family type I secretion periplasmic adaptor subunit [Pseudomonadota bacterium]